MTGRTGATPVVLPVARQRLAFYRAGCDSRADLSRAGVEAMLRAGCWQRTVRAMGCIYQGIRPCWQDAVTEVPILPGGLPIRP